MSHATRAVRPAVVRPRPVQCAAGGRWPAPGGLDMARRSDGSYQAARKPARSKLSSRSPGMGVSPSVCRKYAVRLPGLHPPAGVVEKASAATAAFAGRAGLLSVRARRLCKERGPLGTGGTLHNRSERRFPLGKAGLASAASDGRSMRPRGSGRERRAGRADWLVPGGALPAARLAGRKPDTQY